MVRTTDSVENRYNMNNPEITFNEHYIRIYKAFKREFGNAHSVLHPCCFFDASPSKVFGNVTYVDGDERAIDRMRESGLKAVCEDIRNYKPTEEHDLLVLVRPGNSVAKNPGWVTQHLRSGGLVLTEVNYGDARRMYEQPKLYELCGGVCDGEPDILDFESKRKPARAFKFDKDKFINFRHDLYEGTHEINWLVFKKK